MTDFLISTTGLIARIHTLPDREPFMLAADLADAYGTETRTVTRAVDRHQNRFPEDFAFRLSDAETAQLKSRAGISMMANRELPIAFTHAGALALSGVLRTSEAAEVSVIVHRAFAAMEKRANEKMRYLLHSFQSEELRFARIKVMVREGARVGLTFHGIWMLGNYSKPKVAKALHQCLAMGLIERLPPGTPELQADLFSGVE